VEGLGAFVGRVRVNSEPFGPGAGSRFGLRVVFFIGMGVWGS